MASHPNILCAAAAAAAVGGEEGEGGEGRGLCPAAAAVGRRAGVQACPLLLLLLLAELLHRSLLLQEAGDVLAQRLAARVHRNTGCERIRVDPRVLFLCRKMHIYSDECGYLGSVVRRHAQVCCTEPASSRPLDLSEWCREADQVPAQHVSIMKSRGSTVTKDILSPGASYQVVRSVRVVDPLDRWLRSIVDVKHRGDARVESSKP